MKADEYVFYLSCYMVCGMLVFQLSTWLVKMMTTKDEDYLREYF